MKLVEFSTNCHPKNRESMRRMCAVKQISYEHTTDRGRLNRGDYELLWLPSNWISPDDLPSHVKIIYGPQFFVFPEGPVVGELEPRWANRAVYTCLSPWVESMWKEFAPSFRVPVRPFPFGVNGDIVDGSGKPKHMDCVVYFKGRRGADLETAMGMLKARGLSFTVFSYGSYRHEDYLKALQHAKFCLWIGASESQGFAFQECMATNTPMLVWGITSMFDEIDRSSVVYERFRGQKNLLATNLNCWDSRCGLVGYSAEEISRLIPRMLTDKFVPREVVLSKTSDEICMNRFLEHFGIGVGGDTETLTLQQIRSDGVIPIVQGGLGNQLFTIAAAYAVHRTKGIPLYILKNHGLANNRHNVFQLDYTISVLRSIGSHLDADQNDSAVMDHLKSMGYRKHHEHGGIGFQPWSVANVAPGSLMPHYYQSYSALAPFEVDLRRVLLEGLAETCAKVVAELGEPLHEAAFLHIRRGDYVGLSHVHYLQPMEYYEACLNDLMTKNVACKKVWVVSDDISWAKSQPWLATKPNVVFFERDNELETLALMAMCRAGAICANSTFSWWGAFLGAYALRNPVFVPKRWISDIESPVDLVPSEWMIVDVASGGTSGEV
jgi:hypothetical protein